MNKLTELTDLDFPSFFTLTTQAPHPPSLHETLVPVNRATSLMKVAREMPMMSSASLLIQKRQQKLTNLAHSEILRSI